MRRPAFTLIELLIAVGLLSLIMLYLYGALSSLQAGNSFYKTRLQGAQHEYKVVKTLYLDLALASAKTVRIVSRERKYDMLFLQTSNSVHQRIRPYVGYFIHEQHLYRVESSVALDYPLDQLEEISVDDLGEAEHLRFYSAESAFLVDYLAPGNERVLFKVTAYNQ